MAELVPVPFGRLLRRAHHEFERRRSIFDLPERKFYRRDAAATDGSEVAHLDLSVPYGGGRAANPIGPAAGPHTQLAQNIALSWLAGARVIELKTVQINDRLALSRPCIDMATVGYNTEWSQELRLDQSLKEYVKASMLIELLGAAGVLERGARSEDSGVDWKRVVFDISVGYDLCGIRSPAIVQWLESMREAGPIVEQLRGEIPGEFAHLRDLPFRTAIASGITLSTFHGTPAGEIERIGEFLVGDLGFHTVIKLNPPMLGRERVEEILHGVLGYDDVTVNPEAYERNLPFDEAVDIVGRLRALAARRELTVGVKCGNTLEVMNRGTFLKERVQYLSGQPLHALHAALVQRWREALGADLQISFSAGVDAHNVADCVAAGLVPVTACTDLLRAGGYGRLSRYITNLEARMRELGGRSIPEFIERAAEARTHAGLKSCAPAGLTVQTSSPAAGELAGATAAGPPVDAVSQAVLRNTEALLGQALTKERYRSAHNRKAPRKLGTRLWLWDCISCSKCVPACPNDAVFEVEVGPFVGDVPVIEIAEGGWREVERRLYRAMKPTQIAIFADACNDCGNCDVFCPEDGGPYLEKPRFFGSLDAWRLAAPLAGFVLDRDGAAFVLRGRFDGGEASLSHRHDSTTARFEAHAAAVTVDWGSHQILFAGIIPASAGPEPRGPLIIDLSAYMTLRILLDALLRPPRVNFVNAAFLE